MVSTVLFFFCFRYNNVVWCGLRWLVSFRDDGRREHTHLEKTWDDDLYLIGFRTTVADEEEVDR